MAFNKFLDLYVVVVVVVVANVVVCVVAVVVGVVAAATAAAAPAGGDCAATATSTSSSLLAASSDTFLPPTYTHTYKLSSNKDIASPSLTLTHTPTHTHTRSHRSALLTRAARCVDVAVAPSFVVRLFFCFFFIVYCLVAFFF